MIEIKNLTKIYRTLDVETTALNQLNLQINPGEFVSIMGESGCGKSTLLNIIGLLDSVSSGQYIFDGQDISRFTERQRTNLRKQNIGFVFQNFNLIDQLTVEENVALPLNYLGLGTADKKQKVQDILTKMGIAHRAKHFPLQLSGGQQQRVAIARAVVTNPKLILADEPTGNLDSKHGKEVMELLTQLNAAGTTVAMVTHSQHDADFSKRTIQLLDGQVISKEPTKVFDLQ